MEWLKEAVEGDRRSAGEVLDLNRGDALETEGYTGFCDGVAGNKARGGDFVAGCGEVALLGIW